ncbi:VTT domain-containing protein [Lysinibacillus sp. G4S2]|uniref:TVP38/TMEM64 family protein n=1 Tax=Lysinibacillus sp. G4S2 TaxID=3055859 RepID=UPI0025A08F04|nr:VTT domain-containing protein [Lysinibacillus sp. G4S2]MDM5248399.1 VTT domain-containing protein [Lysinibacillus sp. G4S2]
MQETFFQLLEQAGPFAVFLSLFINIVVSIIGVLPSVFITAGNLTIFGLYNGLIVSIIGEGLGALISFILYRKGLKKWRHSDYQHPVILKLKQLEGYNAFWVILCLRILPFVPSGVITLGCAFSKVSLGIFTVASTLGKIPSLIIEASAIYGFMQVDLKWKYVIIIVTLILFLIWKVKNKSSY